VVKEESYFLQRRMCRAEIPAGTDHFAGSRRSLEVKNTAEQRFPHPTLFDGSPAQLFPQAVV
jgi:hypothetical protein